MSDRLIEIKDLHLHFQTYGGTVKALRGVELHVDKGETLGLVGESGCGKSQTAMALMRLTPIPPGEFVKGEIHYDRPVGEGREWTDLLKIPEREMRRIRGNDISMIFQEPMTSLNPVMTVGEQITEVIVNHQDLGVPLRGFDRWMLRRGWATPRVRRAHRAALPRAVDMLTSIGIADAESIMTRYPHELSGGMRQRVMIAIALSCDPDLLVADEPTTALDVTIQAQIMDLMRSLKKRTGAAILLITHHLGVVAEMADRIAVMYAGRIAEVGPAKDVFKTPKHPYTLGLLNSIPDITGEARVDALPVIPGNVPNLIDPPAGCPYHPRCPFAFSRCREKVPELQPAGAQKVACHLYDADQEVPRALREKDASVYLRPPEETAFAPNEKVLESEASRQAVPG
ncbi:MAG TPA: ABC transporter ATP-binding protein [Candidatus Thermoplasmatota archaeon]|nr:ABC transporter ATP-binding protein [Candidatus Thermoplasmatota archaeon]